MFQKVEIKASGGLGAAMFARLSGDLAVDPGAALGLLCSQGMVLCVCHKPWHVGSIAPGTGRSEGHAQGVMGTRAGHNRGVRLERDRLHLQGLLHMRSGPSQPLGSLGVRTPLRTNITMCTPSS